MSHMSTWICPALAAWLVLGCALQAAEPTPETTGPPGETTRSVCVAGIVLKWIRGDKEANFRRAEPMIREAARAGAKIVVTTECFLDGYAIADKSIPLDIYRNLGEPIPGGPYFGRLAALADELDIHLVAGMLEADDDQRFNTALLLGPDGTLLGKYHKQKLGHESVRNTPGNASLVFDLPYGRVGLLICADRTEPTIVGRFATGGAEFLICPSGGMFGPKTNDPIVQARSRENGLFILFVHPAEFLVTAPDGSIATRTLLGNRLLIAPQEAGGETDQNRVFYFHLPLPAPRKGPASPLKKSGSGPIFGETTRFSRESLPENLDLTPSFHFTNGLLRRERSSTTSFGHPAHFFFGLPRGFFHSGQRPSSRAARMRWPS